MKRTIANHRLKKAIKMLQRIHCMFLCMILVALFLFSGYVYKRPDVIYGICEKLEKRNSIVMEPFLGEYKTNLGQTKFRETEQEMSLAVLSIEHAKIPVTYNCNLILVNSKYPLDEDNCPILSGYKETGSFIAKEAEMPLNRLFQAAMKETGESIGVTSLFRSKEKQKLLYELDSRLAAFPGYSEHETGLAIDLKSSRYAQRYFIKSKVGRWINDNCASYGFIIRYPYQKEEVTGFFYEPWHIRYVGYPHAEIMYKNRLTLEEYLGMLETGTYYKYYDTVIGAFYHLEHLMLPKDTISVTISPDNTGRYIVTCRQLANAYVR